jgi:hypothetical protein
MPTYLKEHEGHRLKVIVRTLSVEFYYDEVQVDRHKGYWSGGDLRYKNPEGDVYRVSVGIGLLHAHCNIYVNDTKIFEQSKIQLNR